MRKFATIIFFLVTTSLFSQKLVCDTIKKLSLYEIYSEITTQNDYSLDDCICFATKLSEYDKAQGIKRVLTYSGIFETPCLKCLYNTVGFETYNFGSDDIFYENVDVFLSTYNSLMEQLIKPEQLNKIKSRQGISDKVFVEYLQGASKSEIQKLSDTTVNLRIHNDTLEQLFQSDINFLKVSITDSISDLIKGQYKYIEMKNIGTNINVKNKGVSKIYVTFDFSDMPDKLEVCWCSILNKKYYLMIPIKLN
jgi:hypothetical protein